MGEQGVAEGKRLLEARWIEEQSRIADAVVDTDDVAWTLNPHDDAAGQQTPPPDEEFESGATAPARSGASTNCGPQQQQDSKTSRKAAVATSAAGAGVGCSGSGSVGDDESGDDVSPSSLPPNASPSLPPVPLRLVGGVDISFVKGSEENACATLVVLAFPSLKTVYETYERVTMHHPYISGFLAFREVDHLARLVNQLRRERPDLLPDVLFVDGNGRLHPRGAGLASHLGVVTGLRTVGLGKTFLQVDGLTNGGVRERVKTSLSTGERETPLLGTSGTVWGTALVPQEEGRGGTKKAGGCGGGVVTNPVFVSIGHRVSLETSVALTKAVGRYRVPEPIRQADMRSREVIRAWLAEQHADGAKHKGAGEEEARSAREEGGETNETPV